MELPGPIEPFDAGRLSDEERLAASQRVFSLQRKLSRLVDAADNARMWLQQVLAELITQLRAHWAAVVEPHAGSWTALVECGEPPFEVLPGEWFDRLVSPEAAGECCLMSQPTTLLAGLPLRRASDVAVLSLALPTSARVEPAVVAWLGPTIDVTARLLMQAERDRRSLRRWRDTLRSIAAFSAVRETAPLLEMIAREATRLLDCDRASIFIRDPDRGELIACPALGVDAGTLRLPEDKGIVGEVIRTRQPILVDDAYADPRFDRSVDAASGYRTRNILCCPLIDQQGQCIGAFEAINRHRHAFQDEDREVLEVLSAQTAVVVQNVQERERLLRSQRQLMEQVSDEQQIIGESPAIVAVRETVARLAQTDLPVLILGESGTGKEIVAHELHYRGPRRDRPFVAVNCAGLPESLLESELFGHEKGAFTDAKQRRQGKFELADGGTLFLDEIGDMSPSGQAKLLRVLEQKVITRVGGTQPIAIDVRVVAATNTRLAEAVTAGRFRDDLYYRLSVVTLELPPLRDRPQDILPLARHFLERFSRQAGRPALELSREAARRLQAHAWPGNVRELRNLMERVAFLAPGPHVEAEDLAFILAPSPDSLFDLVGEVGLSEATLRFQRQYVRRAIERVNGNMSEAARLLGLHRSNLYRKMHQLGMSVEEVHSPAER